MWKQRQEEVERARREARLSKVEKKRLATFRMRQGIEVDDTPERYENSRRAMRNLVRWRNKKRVGFYNPKGVDRRKGVSND